MATILVADDEPSIRLVLRCALVDAGHEVAVAANGREAEALLMQRAFDILVSDIRMPELDGLTLFRRVRGRWPQTRVVLMTADGDLDDAVAALKDGAADYVQKPFEPEELVDRVSEVMRRAAVTRGQARVLVEAREAVAGMEQDRDRVIATVMHELRSPVSAIRMAVDALQDGADAMEAGELVGIVDRQSQSVARIVSDLLDASRLARGGLSVDLEVADLAAVIESAEEATRALVRGKRHTLTTAIRGAPLRVHADPVRLTQVFTNLLSNAARYTPDGGRITIDASPDGAMVVVRVRDDGIGMSADLVTRAFQPFVRGEAAQRAVPGGLGVGLDLARKLVELQGGTLEAHSDGEDLGSELVVRVRRAADPPTAGSN